ncbi:COG2378 Predicted transcriptional regulator [Candidatus Nanopelagicaceae bacterium]
MYFHVDVDQLRVHTVSRKSERLVNLTIALLATKRYLTKAEIFKSVAGYSGDAEAKDRMFERDKDDLRSLGITIELGTFDPLFEDEAGYRIKPESYALQLKSVDPLSIALLSQAGKMWREAALGDSAQSGLRKLKSLGIDSDIDSLVELTSGSHDAPEQLPELIEAISDRRRISFEYLDEELTSKLRNVEPYRLSNSRGYWYLIGLDTDKGALRTFRLDRFDSTVSMRGSANSFDVDLAALDNIDLLDEDDLLVAKIAVRKGKAPSLRTEGATSELDIEWDCLDIPYRNEKQLIREVLWAGENAYILEPAELKEKIVSILKLAVSHHG